MLLAAIDIGTNAVRLLFSNAFRQNGNITVEKASLVRIPIRLGEDVFNNNRISPEKTGKLIKTMEAFKLLIEVYQPVAFKACATAAMREAQNRKEVLDAIRHQTGIEIEIIDGLKEASLLSAVSDMRIAKEHDFVMFVDVGGGSTEISILKDRKIIDSASFRIGTVRLLNKKVKKKEWDALKVWLKKFTGNPASLLLVGSGGNINKITKLYGRIPENTLSYDNLEYALKHLSLFSLKERIEIMGLRPDRADVIIPAGQIFRFIMKQLNTGSIYVPKVGLSDGIIHNLYSELNRQ